MDKMSFICLEINSGVGPSFQWPRPLFVFSTIGPKQNARSLLAPVSDPAFHAHSHGSLHFLLHGSSNHTSVFTYEKREAHLWNFSFAGQLLFLDMRTWAHKIWRALLFCVFVSSQRVKIQHSRNLCVNSERVNNHREKSVKSDESSKVERVSGLCVNL